MATLTNDAPQVVATAPEVVAPKVPENKEVRIEDLLSAPNTKVFRGCVKQSETYIDRETNEPTAKRYGVENSFKALVHNAMAAENACKELGIPIQEGHGAKEAIETGARRLGLSAEKATEIQAGMDLSDPQLPQSPTIAPAMRKEAAVTAFLINVRNNVAPEVYESCVGAVDAKCNTNFLGKVETQLATLKEDREQTAPTTRRQILTAQQREDKALSRDAMAIRVTLTSDTFDQWKTEAKALNEANPQAMPAEQLARREKQIDAMKESFQLSYATRVPKLDVQGDKMGIVMTGPDCDRALTNLAKDCRETTKALEQVQAQTQAVEAPVVEQAAPEAPAPQQAAPEPQAVEQAAPTQEGQEKAKPARSTRAKAAAKTKDQEAEL